MQKRGLHKKSDIPIYMLITQKLDRKLKLGLQLESTTVAKKIRVCVRIIW